MTTIAPAPMSSYVLLIKAQTYKHSAGYYLLNGRWHKLNQSKPAPKGAPIAAHPTAGGVHIPKQHFTEDEWKQLELPADNTNAGTYNKQLGVIKQHADDGNVTAILGSQFGVNTYGKKLSIIANKLLEMYGSEHKVAPGQKAGEHHAVKVQADADKHEQANQVAQHKADHAVAAAAAPAAESATVKEPVTVPPATGLAMPEFVEGKTTTGVVDYYQKAAQKVIDMASSGDADGLAQMKADGLKPNAKGKVSNTWAGKTANSKLLIGLHDDAVAAVGGAKPVDKPAPAPEPTPKEKVKQATAAASAALAKDPEFQEAVAIASKKPSNVDLIPWDSQLLPDSNTNAKSHNGKVAQIKAMAEAGDLAGLEAFKAGKNTYGKKQMQLAALSIAALKESSPAAVAQKPADATDDGKPVKPNMTFAPGSSWGTVLDQIEEAIEHNNDEVIEDSITMTEGLPSAGAQAVNAYAKQALAYLQDDTPVVPKAPEPPAAKTTPVDTLNAEMATAGSTSEALAAAKTFLTLNGDHVQNLNYAAESLEAHGFKIASETLQQEYGQVMLDDDDDEPVEPEAPTPISAAVMTLLVGWVKKGKPHDPALADLFGKISEEDKASILSIAEKTASGPKDGDTKQGMEGMLVFKDGHWHKQEAAPHAIDAIAEPDLSDFANPGMVAGAIFKLKQAIKADGAGALSGVTKKMSASGKLITKLPHPTSPGKTLKISGYESSPDASHSKIFHYVEALKAAAGKPSKVKAPKVTAAPAPAPTGHPFGVEAMDGWKQTGPQGGSNPGGKFVDDQGVEWYCKFPGNDDVAKSEVLAAKLYAAAGIAGQDAKLITKDGKLGIASKWQTVSKLSPAALSKADGVASGFAVDAWLGNWDVVGMGYDNLQVGPDGKAMRVDAGGSLEYRAQGGKKAFGDHVVEIDSLRDAKINPQSAAVFGKLSQADLTASVSKVLGVSDAKIHALVHAFGPGDAAAKQKMIDTLIARKADLAAKFPKAKKEKKVKPFKPEKISEPPSFLNWGGSGKSGPSSKEFLNAANESAVQAIYTAAQTGNLEAVQALSANIYNKESGEITGSAPVLEHPSQHVKGYAQQAINEINYQLHPPKRFRFEGGHPLNSLHSAYPSHKGPLHNVVAKVGKFILLGEPGTISLDSLALPKHTYQSGAITTATFSSAAKKSIAAMPETQKQAIKAYTGSSYQSMNNSLWSGNPTGAAKSAGEALHALGHDVTPGTVLSRKISVHGTDLEDILKSSGKILQEPAIMSTSIRPSSWSGNVQLKMHVGPGVKGLWVGKGSVGSNGALSNHSGEDELILPPNTRLLILSVKKSSGPDTDGFGNGVGHVIEAVILPSQAAS